MRSGIAWALLAGCGARWTPSATDSAAGVQDLDGDGYIATAAGGEDCDDLNPSINPAGTEICDGRDDDCDGLTDEADGDLVPDEWAADADGYGDPAGAVRSCDGRGLAGGLGRGRAEVISGPISGTVVLAGGSPRVAGESAGDQLGASVAGLGSPQ